MQEKHEKSSRKTRNFFIFNNSTWILSEDLLISTHSFRFIFIHFRSFLARIFARTCKRITNVMQLHFKCNAKHGVKIA